MSRARDLIHHVFGQFHSFSCRLCRFRPSHTCAFFSLHLFIYSFLHSSAVLLPSRASSSGDYRHDSTTTSFGSVILPGNTVGASSKEGGGDRQEVGSGVGSSSGSELFDATGDNATYCEPSGGGVDRITQGGEKTTVSFCRISLSFSSFIHHNNHYIIHSYQPPEWTE